jgi:hypothetical protein
VKALPFCLALLPMASFSLAQSGQDPGGPGTLRTNEIQPVYAASPDDPWNQIFYCLFTRTIKARVSSEFQGCGPFATFSVNFVVRMSLSTHSVQRVESGDRAVEPLYPLFPPASHHGGPAELLAEPRFTQFKRALTQAVDEDTTRPTLARALMQSDAWAAFDILHRFCTDNKEVDQTRYQQLEELLARLIRKLALTPGEIGALPDNYQAAVRLQDFPDLFAASGQWLEVERGQQRFHDRAADFRRAARVFVKPAVPPRDVQAFLSQLADSRGKSAEVEAVALVMQLLLVDTNGQVMPTRLTYEVQLRTFLPGPETKVNVNELSRRLLLKDPRSSRFESFRDKDPAYLRAAGNHYAFATPLNLAGTMDDSKSREPVLVSLRRSCVACHQEDAKHIVTFGPKQNPASAPPVKILSVSDNAHARFVAEAKTRRADFKALQQRWGKRIRSEKGRP